MLSSHLLLIGFFSGGFWFTSAFVSEKNVSKLSYQDQAHHRPCFQTINDNSEGPATFTFAAASGFALAFNSVAAHEAVANAK